MIAAYAVMMISIVSITVLTVNRYVLGNNDDFMGTNGILNNWSEGFLK